MFRSYRVGTLFGFPIEINLSFLLLLGLVLLWMGGITGLFVIVIAFSSVLLHEIGHALMARHLGVHIAGIELHFFGGAAKMTSAPRTANDEVAIAAAGPAVSFALGGSGLALGAVTGLGFFQLLGWLNIVIGLFNMIPALPMDGGRILRALLTRKASFARATEISITVARVFAVILGVYGLITMHLLLPALAALLWFMGSAELRMARMMNDHVGYDENGYRLHGMDDPFGGWSTSAWPVHPGASAHRRHPAFSVHRPVRTSGFVIRRRDGRLVIDYVE